MKNSHNYNRCLNCEFEDFKFTKGYCTKCYPLILKIEKIKKGILPRVLKDIHISFKYFEQSQQEYIRQVKRRLEIIKESRSLKYISAHDLEYRINNTLKIFGSKDLGKINDSLAHYLQDDRARSYIYQLFTKIQLLKPFKINYWRLYEAASNKEQK